MQATQNFSIGVILDAESDGIKIFWKLKNFTISRNKLRVQPLAQNKVYYRLETSGDRTVGLKIVQSDNFGPYFQSGWYKKLKWKVFSVIMSVWKLQSVWK